MQTIKTRESVPPKILIYSEHGLGKSSLAAAAPNPIFINVENGLAEIDTEMAGPVPETLGEIQSQLSSVLHDKHEYKTLVIDTLDWMETRINEHVCRQGGQTSIADFEWGSGYSHIFEETIKIQKMLDIIHKERKMCIILLSHAIVRNFKNPLGANYDTYHLKLREKNAQLYLEFLTLVGFLHISTYVNTEKKGFKEKTTVTASASRVLSVCPTPCFQAKNRYWIKEDIQIPSPQQGFINLMQAIKPKQEVLPNG